MNTYTQNLLNKATEINANIEIDPTSGVITLFNDILTNFYGTLSDTHMIKLIAAIKGHAEGFTVKCTDGCYILTNPRSQGCPRFQSGEELANSVGKINA